MGKIWQHRAHMKASIIVLTRNRKEDVAECLASLRQQTYPDLELILVDNGSTDETLRMVRARFPRVRIIALGYNSGVTHGRNAGIKIARGEVLIFIDDDAVVKDNELVTKVVELFEMRPRMAALGFQERTYQPPHDLVQWHYRGRPEALWSERGFEAAYYPGAGHALRVSALREVGVYPENFFYSTEEKDLTFRLINAEYQIWYTPSVQVFHKVNLRERALWRHYFDLRNHTWFAMRQLPWFFAGLHVMLWSARITVKTFPHSHRFVPRALGDAWRRRHEVLVERKPLTPKAQQTIQTLRQTPLWWL
jgi:GT2 family glycosyltransferase